MSSSLIEAARQEDVKALQHHLDNGADINQTDHFHRSALAWAAFYGYLECVQLLVSRKAALELAKDEASFPWTDQPLALASCQDHVQVVQVLLDARANIDSPGLSGWTPIMCAAQKWYAKQAVALLLRRGADLNVRSAIEFFHIPTGSTVMDIAKKSGCSEIVKLLETAQNIPWLPDLHKHFSSASSSFPSSVMALLIFHRTTLTSGDVKRIQACQADANNRFWKLPKPLLFLILAFAAPPTRLVPM